MREIRQDVLNLPQDWEVRAQAAQHGSDARKASLWAECKAPLKAISFNKCFYCEMIQERSDGAVDHFRPKSRYPWSALDFRNYRFSCTFCNSRRTDPCNDRVGGKGDFFPLFDENQRATCFEEEDSETPLLLDPCKPGEPSLIDFDDTGMPVPTYSTEEHAGRNSRAEISIELYHLNHQDLVDYRVVLAELLVRKIRAAEKLFPLTEIGHAEIDASFNEHIQCLTEAIRPNAQLSVFARRILDGHRDKPWISGILRTV
jgi:uncharacterized protein (TIGR02646 family)